MLAEGPCDAIRGDAAHVDEVLRDLGVEGQRGRAHDGHVHLPRVDGALAQLERAQPAAEARVDGVAGTCGAIRVSVEGFAKRRQGRQPLTRSAAVHCGLAHPRRQNRALRGYAPLKSK